MSIILLPPMENSYCIWQSLYLLDVWESFDLICFCYQTILIVDALMDLVGSAGLQTCFCFLTSVCG